MCNYAAQVINWSIPIHASEYSTSHSFAVLLSLTPSRFTTVLMFYWRGCRVFKQRFSDVLILASFY